MELGDERVAVAAVVPRVEGPRGGGEVRGDGGSGDVGGPRRVDRDADAALVGGPAEVGGVGEAWVDYQRLVGSVISDPEPVGVAGERVTAVHRDAAAVDALEALWGRVADGAEGGSDPKRPSRAEREALGASVGEPDVGGPCPRAEAKLVGEPSAPAPKDHVDPWPQLAVDEPAVGGEVGVALGAGEVVDPSGAAIGRDEPRVRVGAQKAQVKRLAPLAPLERQHRLAIREVEAVPGPLRVVADPLIGLAGVGDEGERQPRVGVRGAAPDGSGERGLRSVHWERGRGSPAGRQARGLGRKVVRARLGAWRRPIRPLLVQARPPLSQRRDRRRDKHDQQAHGRGHGAPPNPPRPRRSVDRRRASPRRRSLKLRHADLQVLDGPLYAFDYHRSAEP